MMGEAAPLTSSKKTRLNNFLGQIPAVALIGMFHLMIGIPFGVSYFPVSWSPLLDEASDEGGPFPMPGKEALGIRMFLFSTIVGQIVFTIFSDFPNPIGLQMVENVPFCHELANIVIAHQGYGIDALSTLIFMFGLSSVVVGIFFLLLGKFQLGRVVHFFPTHVSFTQYVGNATFNPCRASNILMPRYHLLLRVGSGWMYRGDRCFHCQDRLGSHSK
jgi:hypothetical protein